MITRRSRPGRPTRCSATTSRPGTGCRRRPSRWSTSSRWESTPALATGPLYDRYGLAVLMVLPVLAFGDSVPAVLAGAVAWGAAMGVQESTMRAAVADLVPAARRGTAYGVFGAV